MKERYGQPHAMQNPVLFHRAMANGFRLKDHTLSSGKVVKVQGYEGYALDYILADDYVDPFLERRLVEDEILVGQDVETLSYEFEGQPRVYYPDMQIKDTNVFIEVKSVYTLCKDWEKNQAKFQAMASDGRRLLVMVFDKQEHIASLRYE